MRLILACLLLTSLHCSTLNADPRTGTNADPLTGASPFAQAPEVPYYTSNPRNRWPSQRFPADPVRYFEQREAGRGLAATGQCAEAIHVLAPLVREYPDDSKIWVDLGLCQARTGAFAAAIESLETALELGTGPFDGSFAAIPAEVMVTIAFLHARIGERDSAIDWLRRALASRFANRPGLASGPEASLLDDDERFRELAGVPPDGTFSRVERWRYDIEFFRSQAAMLHYDPDALTPAPELDRYLDALAAAVPALSDEEIVARLVVFMGKLGQGHDVLLMNTGRYGFPVPFAIMLYVFTDGIYVIDAEDATLTGARLDAIDDVPADEALRDVVAAIARDNGMSGLWLAPRYLANPTVLEALGVVADADAVALTVTDRDGRTRRVTPARHALPATPSSLVAPDRHVPLYLSDLGSRFWTQPLPDAEALYVQINGIADAPDETFSAFASRLREEARAPDVLHLIIDLRHNMGGTSYLNRHLVRALVEFEMAPDKGEIYVLIGRNTFSSAQSLVTGIETLTDAIFVGEPTGSRPNFIGRVGQFRLPFSELSGFVSSEYSQETDAEDHRIWVAPDMPVGLTSTAYFAGEDPALAAVRRAIVSTR